MKNNIGSDLLAALVNARANINALNKSKTADAGKYKYNYVPLPEVIKAIWLVLANNGITVHSYGTEEGVVTTLFHVDTSQCISSLFPWDRLPTGAAFSPNSQSGVSTQAGMDYQSRGKNFTYGMRYNLTALLMLELEDDDGEGEVKQYTPAAKTVKLNNDLDF